MCLESGDFVWGSGQGQLKEWRPLFPINFSFLFSNRRKFPDVPTRHNRTQAYVFFLISIFTKMEEVPLRNYPRFISLNLGKK